MLVQQAMDLGWEEADREGTLLLTHSHLHSLGQASLCLPAASQPAAQVLR